LLIDLHAHILPGVDDGAKTIEDSLAMAEVAFKDGITMLVATPHVVRGIFDNRKEGILRDVKNLNNKLKQTGNDLLVLPGAEYRLEPDLAQRLADGQLITINNAGRYLLIELPSALIPENTERILYEIQLQGVTPIIAHPERNLTLAKHPELLGSYNDRGILAQVTAASITGLFGKIVRKTALSFLQNGTAQIIASDGHGVNGRSPVLTTACRVIEHRWGAQFTKTLAFENPHRIIRSQRVPAYTPPKKEIIWKRFRT